MTIQEFQSACLDLATSNESLAAVQRLGRPEVAPAIFDSAENMDDWDPWG